MAVNSSSLVYTGADKAVVSHETVRKLNMKVKPTQTRAKDGGGRLLLILGKVTIHFRCTCLKHKGENVIKQTALVLENIGEVSNPL